MSEPSLSGMTLRQKLIEADKLSRELNDHLERGYLPRLQKLRRLTRHGGAGDAEGDAVTDVTVRTAAEQLIQHDDFARNLYDRLERILASIESEARQVTG